MPEIPTIDIGENFLFRRTFKLSDGVTPVTFSDIQFCSCVLSQNGVGIKTYTYIKEPDEDEEQFSEGFSNPESSMFQVELSQAVSLLLKRQLPLDATWDIKVTNLDFALDNHTQRDKFKEVIAKVK